MFVDVQIKDVYLEYTKDIEKEFIEINDKLKRINVIKQELIEYLDKNKSSLQKGYNIDLAYYDLEWKEHKYNPAETLYQLTNKYIKKAIHNDNRIVLLQLLKYCHIIRQEDVAETRLNIINRKKNITYPQYRNIIYNYYLKVHRVLLEGDAYKFNYGIGKLLIIYRINVDGMRRAFVDFKETNKRKKEIIEKGLIPYNKEDELEAFKKGIPYNGVKYIVHKHVGSFCEVMLYDSRIYDSGNIDYAKDRTCDKEMYGRELDDYINDFNSFDEIVDTPKLYLTAKLNCILNKYPNKYLNFVRYADGKECEYRTDNSET